MLQEIAPHVFHNEFCRPEPRPRDLVLAFDGPSVLLTRAGGGFPCAEEILALSPEAKLVYLFRVDETDYFLLWEITEAVRRALQAIPASGIRTMEAPEACLVGATALHLSNWYRANRFCGCCGAANRLDEAERAMRCPRCNAVVYPRINPAVLAAVRDGERLLLTRYANRPSVTRYALVAGFTEIGETLEDTVRRELLEEVGLRVGNVRYHASQPWGFAGNIMVGFWADLEGPDAVRLQTDELSEAVWLRREEIPASHHPIDLTHTMIELFRRGLDPR